MLSPQQYQALRFLQRYTYEEGRAPTYKEVAAHCGIHIQTIVQKFRKFVAKGRLTIDPVLAQRAYRLTPKACQELAEFEMAAKAAGASLEAGIASLRKWTL